MFEAPPKILDVLLKTSLKYYNKSAFMRTKYIKLSKRLWNVSGVRTNRGFLNDIQRRFQTHCVVFITSHVFTCHPVIHCLFVVSAAQRKTPDVVDSTSLAWVLRANIKVKFFSLLNK